MSLHLTPIGTVESAFTEIADRDWHDVIAKIHINEALAPGLQGIEENSHIVVIFYLHQSKFEPEADLVRRPMDRADLPLTGVFATRSNYRPNPVALTTVELLKIEKNTLTVRGMDALDGTPVIDIKPYVPRKDCKEDARTPAWAEKLRQEQAHGTG